MNPSEDDRTSEAIQTRKGDCYSEGERAWMEYGQELRATYLGPLLRLLTALEISPDHLTLASLGFGIAFGPLWYFHQPVLAMLCVAIHVLLDGLDGPLARHQGVASPRGSFTDSFCDQVAVSVITIALMVGAPPFLSILGGSIFLVCYTGVLALSMVRNHLAIPYSWLIRPRFFLFLAIPVQWCGISHAVEVVVWISNLLLAWKGMTGFFKLRARISGPDI